MNEVSKMNKNKKIYKAVTVFSFFSFFSLSLLCIAQPIFASAIVPTGNSNNFLYYKIGGESDVPPPAVSTDQTIQLKASADLGAGYQCGAFNPALSISNTFNDLKNEVDNLAQTVLSHATGSLAQMPMYFLAQANPTAYNLINNALLAAHKEIDISVKSCQDAKNQIAQGKNPYHDWATLAIGDQWKQHLSLTASGQEDINDAKKDLDQQAGNNGLPWVQGNSVSNKSNKKNYYAGGLNQPPIHVIADTVKAGYNALLLRDLNATSPAPLDSQLAQQFPTPSDAITWITKVIGDQTITTCQGPACQFPQDSISGQGLLPRMLICTKQVNQSQFDNDCVATIRQNLSGLVAGKTAITKDNLEAVSAHDLVLSSQVIHALQGMESTQQSILINKLAQDVAIQRVIDRALLAKTLLETGSQVPVIAANTPAQKIIHQGMQRLEQDIQSLAFEANIRKQLLSNTLGDVLNYQQQQEENTIRVPAVILNAPLMENSALPAHKKASTEELFNKGRDS